MTNWIWVTGPEYYLNDDGSELELGGMSDGAWWTCSSDLTAGDHVLLYRKTPKKDIKYLLQAETDAEILPATAGEFAGQPGCGYRAVQTFDAPLTIAEMREDPVLNHGFSALRGRFQGRSFAVEPDIWERLLGLLRSSNEVPLLPDQMQAADPILEKVMEARIAGDLDLLGIGGLRLQGRQAWTGAGYVDLLCRDSSRGWVVIEVKRNRIDRRALGQLLSYMGWIKRNLAAPSHRIRGRLIGRGMDVGIDDAISLLADVEYISYERWEA
jgi:hypothetical protein